MKIPFTKAHGAKNDFLFTWRQDVPPDTNHEALSIAICDRHTGIGADGWMLVDPPRDAEAEGGIQLYNSDGSIAEMSGNGTRCAAAFLIKQGLAAGVVRVRTGAGIKTLRLLERTALAFQFEMNMGRPEITAERFQLELSWGPRDVTLLWVGNPQCAVPVQHFDFDWRALGGAIERHPHFPNRTNVSFVKPVDEHTIDVRFWERGAGETMSSGTGSTGAAAMAVARGLVQSPVRVQTPAGSLDLRFDGDIFLTGPAEIVAEGVFFLGLAGGSVLRPVCAAVSDWLGDFASRLTAGKRWKTRAMFFVLAFSLFRAFPDSFLRASGVAESWEHGDGAGLCGDRGRVVIQSEW